MLKLAAKWKDYEEVIHFFQVWFSNVIEQFCAFNELHQIWTYLGHQYWTFYKKHILFKNNSLHWFNICDKIIQRIQGIAHQNKMLTFCERSDVDIHDPFWAGMDCIKTPYTTTNQILIYFLDKYCLSLYLFE